MLKITTLKSLLYAFHNYKKFWKECNVLLLLLKRKEKYIHTSVCIYVDICMHLYVWRDMIVFQKIFAESMREMKEYGWRWGKRSWRKENNRYKFLPLSSGIHSSCLMIHVSLYPGVVGGQKQTWLHYRQLFHNNSGPFFISCLPSQQNTG